MIAGGELVGESELHRGVLDTLRRVAPSDVEVLITGPSGVGKELYARYVHDQSARRDASFVAINCAVLTDELFENELFGHIAGAFTGARREREGLVAAAEGGTLFLDEVDALSAANQVKMLRFVQHKEYRRLGETRLRRANVRLIAASNADLVAAVQHGRMREDLLFRLRVVPVEVTPLCERPADLGPLLARFIEQYARAYRLPPIVLGAAARERMERYRWPGNVRELENMVRYLTCIQLARAIEPGDLPLLRERCREAAPSPTTSFKEAKHATVAAFEREQVIDALARAKGNIAKAARTVGKPRRSFFSLMRKHGISADAYRDA
jgi:two-component system, NtrC family, response regulator GlrR